MGTVLYFGDSFWFFNFVLFILIVLVGLDFGDSFCSYKIEKFIKIEKVGWEAVNIASIKDSII